MMTWRNGLRFVLAPLGAAGLFCGLAGFILARGTTRVYGFVVALDLDTLVEGALQICPLIAALSLVLLAPLRDHLSERFAARRTSPPRASAARVLGVTLAALASAMVFLALTILVVTLLASGRPLASQAFRSPQIWLALLFDLTLISIFTHFLHLLTRRWLLSILIFLAYVVAVFLVGPRLNVTEYIGFASTPGIVLTAYDPTPINFEAAWSWRLYWLLVTAVMLALIFDYGRPGGSLVAAIRSRARKLEHLPAGALALVAAVAAVLAAFHLSERRAAAVRPYQVNPYGLSATMPAGSESRASLERFALDLDYVPGRRQIAVRGNLTLVNDRSGEPLPWILLEKSPLLKLTGEIAGDRPLAVETEPSGRLVAVTPDAPLAPGERLEIDFSGTISAADRFDSVGRGLVLSRAFFLTSGHVLPFPRSPDCFDAPARRADAASCNAGENYLTADGASGRLTVTAPRDLEVASVADVTVTEAGRSSRSMVSIDGTRLSHFFVACAAFASATAPAAEGLAAATVHGASGDGARLREIASSAQRTIARYQKSWPAYRYDRLRILETPASLAKATAYAGAMSISEKLLGTRAARSEESSGLAKLVLAHELAHQWWGYALIPGRAPGRLFVLESIAQFAAYVDLDHQGILDRKTAQAREEHRYRQALTRPGIDDRRLDQIENEDWLAYHKGPFVLLLLDGELDGDLMRTLGRVLAARGGTPASVAPALLIESLIEFLPGDRRATARELLTTTNPQPAPTEAPRSDAP